jgi:hypothetical protein
MQEEYIDRQSHDWIKLNNYKEVRFPGICPYTLQSPDSTKRFAVSDDSILMRIVGTILRFDRIILFDLPCHSSGVKAYRKQQLKATLKGLLWALPFALAFMVIGVAVAVNYRENELYERLGIMLGGIGFMGCLIAFPIFHYDRSKKKNEAILFKNKRKELWVKIKNEQYESEFVELNEHLILDQK